MGVNIRFNNYIKTGNDVYLVSEGCVEGVLYSMGVEPDEEDDGVSRIDSVVVLDYAEQYGFKNIGDFGDGRVFVIDGDNLDEDFKNIMTKGGLDYEKQNCKQFKFAYGV